MAIDQFSKYLIMQSVMLNGDIVVIKNFFYITFVKNFGIAFGLFQNSTTFFVIMNSIISIAVIYFLKRSYKKNRLVAVCLSMILGGALGNLIDRIRLGYVVDFLHFTIFPPVFNIADSAVVIGAFALSAIILLNKDISL